MRTGAAAVARRWLPGADCSCPVLVWLALAGGTAAALVRGVAAPVPVLAGAVALAAWYGWWTAPRLAGSAAARVAYFAGAGLGWAGLMLADRSYGLLGVALAVRLFGYLDTRAAFAALVAVTGAAVAAGGLAGTVGSLSWQGVDAGQAGSTALTLALVGLCLYLGRRAAAARAELAAAQRRIGTLDERQRLAADLHDTVTQDLAGVVMLVEAARDSYRTGRPDAGAALDQALESARTAAGQVRGLVWDLRPEPLREQDLRQALAALTARLTDGTGVAARTVTTGAPRCLPAPVEAALLRVAQEALANATRHAHASAITVTLTYLDDTVALDIVDDGVGFDPAATAAAPGGGLGLPGMRERIQAHGGTLSVESAPGAGTSIAATVPAGGAA